MAHVVSVGEELRKSSEGLVVDSLEGKCKVSSIQPFDLTSSDRAHLHLYIGGRELCTTAGLSLQEVGLHSDAEWDLVVMILADPSST